jgi:DNA-binding NarL/FixJ family response regulator
MTGAPVQSQDNAGFEMEQDRIKVALVEDSNDEREALCILLRGSPGFSCVGAFDNGEAAVAELPALLPHVILMDINLPGISGTECIRRLRPIMPATRVMMRTVFEDHDRIFQSLRAGANGYLLKKTPPAKLLEAIEDLHHGGAPMSAAIARQVVDAFHEPGQRQDDLAQLSTRELEILNLLARGHLYKEIALQLSLSLGTVRTYIGRIYEKLHVRSRAEAMLKVLPKQSGKSAPKA